jgi:beta-glucanase (GH16 family)
MRFRRLNFCHFSFHPFISPLSKKIKSPLFMKSNLFTLIFCCILHNLSAQCWLPVWSDEFNGTTLDLQKWEPQIGGGGWGNNELQYYTARPENIEMSGTSLKIIARAENYGGEIYTSARLRTKNLADFTFGKFEAEMKLPAGAGLWPAYWMLPSETFYGIWPAGGEIDFMEYLGQNTATCYHTVHAGMPLTSSSTTYNLASGSFSSTFHIFSAEWEPNVIRFYVDGILVSTKTPSNIAPPAIWRFDRIFHQILNLAVGGNWPGTPPPATQFPAEVEVKYVRVFQKNEHLAITGFEQIEPAATGIIYKLPSIGGTYNWSVPSGATIVSGQGTNQISVNFGAASGNISCTVNNACGTSTRVLAVIVTPNVLKNASFEQNLTNWTTSACCGSVADFTLNSANNPPNGANSMCANVTSIGPDSWNTQFFQSTPTIVSGIPYTLSFQAKCDVAHSIGTALWRPSGTVMYHAFPNIGTAWATYSYSFTPVFSMPVGAMQLNFDVGGATGEYCFDQILLAKTSTLPLELLDFQGVMTTSGVQLRWATSSETNLDKFEIERSGDGFLFDKIGEITAQNLASEYSYIDKNVTNQKDHFYRLKIVGIDGEIDFSRLITLKKADNHASILVFPNPSTTHFSIEIFDNLNEQIATFQLFDWAGKLIEKGTFWDKISLDAVAWPTGVYFLKIQFNKKNIGYKLIRQ